jgi:hypothetical protein
MVEPVVRLLIGRGHRVIRARQAGLASEADSVVGSYALVGDLVIVTFDPHFRASARRGGARCLHIQPPERTARNRLAEYHADVVRLFLEARERLVTLPIAGPPAG